jgi:hypothetical protein
VTVINDNSNNTTIEGNNILRTTFLTALEETDHGIYAHSFNGLTVIEKKTCCLEIILDAIF